MDLLPIDRFITLVGLTFAVFSYPALVIVLDWAEWTPDRYSLARTRVGSGLEWLVTAVLIAFVVVIERRTLGSIGLRITSNDEMVSGVVLGMLIVLVAMAVTTFFLKHADVNTTDEVGVLFLAQPARWKVFLALTAGVTEEIIFRGYLIERTLELTGSGLVAGTLSVGAFTLAHRPRQRTLRVLAPIVGMAIGFVVAYLLIRNVVVLAIVHTAINALIWFSANPEEALERMDTSRLDDRVVSRFGDE